MNAYRMFLWGSKIAPLLPEWLGNLIANLAGLILYLAVPARRRAVMANLAHALSDKPLKERRRVARQIFQNNIRNYYDLLRAYKIPPAKLAGMVEVTGLEESLELAEKNGNRGIIIFSGHLGSFSMASQIATSKQVDFYLLVEPIKPPELFELVRKLRGVDPRSKTISVGSSEIRQMFRLLKQPRTLVCIAIDRDVTGNGVPLEFFGEETILPAGTAEIALRTGALLVPIQVYRQGKNHYITLYPERSFVADSTGDKEQDVKRVAEKMLDEVERLIRKTPDQWVVLQPIWKDRSGN